MMIYYILQNCQLVDGQMILRHVESIIMSKKKIIKSYNDNCTESKVDFAIQFEEGKLDDYMDKKEKT